MFKELERIGKKQCKLLFIGIPINVYFYVIIYNTISIQLCFYKDLYINRIYNFKNKR